MSRPSPTFPTIPSSFVDLVQGGIDLNTENGFDFEIEDSQYKTMAKDLADREAEHYTHTETKIYVVNTTYASFLSIGSTLPIV
jgi:hypothetical protein